MTEFELERFDDQLLDVMVAMWTASRSGYNASSIFDYARVSVGDPASTLLCRAMIQQVSLGITIVDALTNLQKTIPSAAFKRFADELKVTFLIGTPLDQVIAKSFLWHWQTIKLKNKPPIKTIQGGYDLLNKLEHAVPDETEFITIRKQLLALEHHLPVYLFGCDQGASSISMITQFGLFQHCHTPVVHDFLRQIASSTRHDARTLAAAVLDNLTIPYTPPSGLKPKTCKVCEQPHFVTEICWMCRKHVCSAHVLYSDMDDRATFCSEAHLLAGEQRLAYF